MTVSQATFVYIDQAEIGQSVFIVACTRRLCITFVMLMDGDLTIFILSIINSWRRYIGSINIHKHI